MNRNELVWCLLCHLEAAAGITLIFSLLFLFMSL